MELEEYKEIVNCNCGKCILRKEVYDETLEYLNKILPRLPEGVKTEIGPDATGVGWTASGGDP